MAGAFTGFPREGLEFFEQLAANNNRDWFLAHKDIYERDCRAPMQALVAELAPRFGEGKITRRETRQRVNARLAHMRPALFTVSSLMRGNRRGKQHLSPTGGRVHGTRAALHAPSSAEKRGNP